ncbi:putative aldehyde dehydrogenase MIS1, partial [Dunaliella salina]
YLLYGDVSHRMAEQLRRPEVADFFARLIQRVSPKSYPQAMAEVVITRKFYENFSGDQVRFLARGFSNPGDHRGQTSNGLRWPFGPVALITPFNFPLEIPALQLMGALYMGNKPLLHVDQKVCIVAEQLLRLLHHCGMPRTDVDFLAGPGATMGEVLKQAQPRSTLFTGSQRVAEKLAVQQAGKIIKLSLHQGLKARIKATTGCSAKKLRQAVSHSAFKAPQQCQVQVLSSRRRYGDTLRRAMRIIIWPSYKALQHGPNCCYRLLPFRLHDSTAMPTAGVCSHKMKDAGTENSVLATFVDVEPLYTAFEGGCGKKNENGRGSLPHCHSRSKVLFGGKPLTGHTIPEVYGAVEPTAVFVPLEEALKPEHFEAVTTELFGPFQVITEYTDEQLPKMLGALEKMTNHLTAAVVSNDINFVQDVLAHTVNGTTYAGVRARTTGAPQNHWFGPAGDPRGAGIGTPEAIRLVWSCHREVITDFGPAPPAGSLKTT